MALKLSSIRRDATRDNEGEWQDIPEWPGVKIKARSINSKDYQIAREMLVQKLMRTLGRAPTSPEMEPMLGKIVATHLLRGWEGIAGDDDALIEYSAKVGLETLGDPDMNALEQQVIWAAMRTGDRDAEFTADAVKNSAAPSATS